MCEGGRVRSEAVVGASPWCELQLAILVDSPVSREVCEQCSYRRVRQRLPEELGLEVDGCAPRLLLRPVFVDRIRGVGPGPEPTGVAKRHALAKPGRGLGSARFEELVEPGLGIVLASERRADQLEAHLP